MCGNMTGAINELGALRWLKKTYSNLNWKATSSFSSLDRQGVDIIGFNLFEKPVMAIQVKSSIHGALRFLEAGCGFINIDGEELSIQVVIPVDEGWEFYK